MSKQLLNVDFLARNIHEMTEIPIRLPIASWSQYTIVSSIRIEL